MKKIFLYGNCQLYYIYLFFKQCDNLVWLRPQDYGINQFDNIKHMKAEYWREFVFFPHCVMKNRVLFQVLNECDYFIFQDVKNHLFVSSEELFKSFSGTKLCIPNFCFSGYTENPDKSLAELQTRDLNCQNKYDKKYIDIYQFISDNWNRQMMLIAPEAINHPSLFYYEFVINKMIEKLPELCQNAHSFSMPANPHINI